MGTIITDAEITALISEPKPLSAGYQSKLQLKPKRGHRERELDIIGSNGSQFRLIMRHSLFNVLDFSAILAYCPVSTSKVFRLADTTERTMSTRIRSKKQLSMTSTSTMRLSGISLLAFAKTLLLSPPNATGISRPHLRA
jgi:hypothetical protein